MAFITLGTVAPGDVLRANSGTAAYNSVIGNVKDIRAAQINVQSVTKTDTTLPYTNPLAAQTFSANITGLDVTITPTASTSKILVIASINIACNDASVGVRLMRGATAIGIGAAAGIRAQVSTASLRETTSAFTAPPVVITHLDSPSTTNATTYGVQFFNTSGVGRDVFVNRGFTDSDVLGVIRSASSITVIEVPV